MHLSPICQPVNFSLAFRECTEGWNFQVKGNFEAASPPLDFGSHHFLTVQQHSHFKHTIWTCTEVNLQPRQTSTLVSENLSGTQVQGCAVVTPAVFFWCWIPQWTAQADQSPPATSHSICLMSLQWHSRSSHWGFSCTCRLVDPPHHIYTIPSYWRSSGKQGKSSDFAISVTVLQSLLLTPALFSTGLMCGWAAGAPATYELPTEERTEASK